MNVSINSQAGNSAIPNKLDLAIHVKYQIEHRHSRCVRHTYLGRLVVDDVVVEVAVVGPLLLAQVELLQPALGLQAVVQVVEYVEVLLHPEKDAV